MQRGGCAEKDHISGDRAGMIVENDRKPRPRWLAIRIDDQNVEHGVIRLPERVRRFGAVPVNEFIAIAKSRCALVRQSRQRRIEAANNRVNGCVGRRFGIALLRDLHGLAVYRRDRRARLA